MAYIPDPDDASQPTYAVLAETAQAEFRALKAKVNGMVAGATANNALVRQTVLQGPTTGVLGIGAGLNVDLKATAVAVYLAFAAGFNNAGGLDYVQGLFADIVSYWAALAASNTSYLKVGLTFPAAIPTLTAAKTLAPPQYGPTYDRTAQSVLQFAGAAGAVVFLDDFGNTWAAAGGAKVQATQFKFGTGGLGGAGGANVLNGTTDYVTSTSFSSLGKGSWALRTWFYSTSLAAVNTVIDATNAAVFGAQLKVTAAGKVGYNLSSTGAANDIAALPVAGAATLLVNTWYFLELTYDALAGVYRSYVNGTQDQSTASASQICAITHINFGGLLSNLTGTVGYLDKPEFLPYCDHPAGTAYVNPAAAPVITTAGYASEWFNTVLWLMKNVSVASAAAATDPTFVNVTDVYVGEADTSGAAVTAVRSYAYQGKYESAFTTPLPVSGAGLVTFNHNIGVYPKEAYVEIECISPDNGYIVGNRIQQSQQGVGGGFIYNSGPVLTPRTIAFTPSTGGTANVSLNTAGASVALTGSKWKYRVIASRAL